MQECLKEVVDVIIGALAARIELFVGMADIGFRLRHGGDIQKDQHPTQMMIAADGARLAGITASGFPFQAVVS